MPWLDQQSRQCQWDAAQPAALPCLGESRYMSGTLPARYTYTGQKNYANNFGLAFDSSIQRPYLWIFEIGKYHLQKPYPIINPLIII